MDGTCNNNEKNEKGGSPIGVDDSSLVEYDTVYTDNSSSFRDACCLHFQENLLGLSCRFKSSRIPRGVDWSRVTDNSEELDAYIFMVVFWDFPTTRFNKLLRNADNYLPIYAACPRRLGCSK
jgi:hypothetical protein